MAFVFGFQDRVSLCNSPGCPGTLFVGKAGLKLTERSACLCLWSASIKGMHHHRPEWMVFERRMERSKAGLHLIHSTVPNATGL